ncbi:ornithine cyclodeaminase family protein [Aureimonas sp. AU4]|uniref:ornithine cyclodeaminase family protein n=1 Tax=Aureimonas sp. AU4 TaxID=1638163 RepID=UPI00078104A2|nr:ornithine cyclodeaminase family protein [Aureimonas sp. AU4]
MISLRYLSRADALRAGGGDWAPALDDVREATRLLRSGEAVMVPESVLPLGGDPRANAYGLPARLGGRFDAAGLKWAVHRAEPDGEVPSITNVTLVNRLSDGRPLGFVESAHLTRMRTAAVSALAMRSLATSPIRQVAVLGAGAQARAHIEMVRELFPGVETIPVWNRTEARRDALTADFAGKAGPPLRPAATPEDAVRDAEVVLCCTIAPEPIVGAGALRPGRLVVQVGYHEIDFALIEAADHVVVDLWGDFAERSAKSLFQMYRAGRFAPQDVSADLPALVVDGWRPAPGASVVFSSFGLNIFDIALASRLLRDAERDEIGTLLPLF